MKRRRLWGIAAFAGLGMLAGSIHAYAADRLVKTPEDYKAAVKASVAGDTVILSNGVWRDFEIVFTGEGAAGKPITLRAQTPGKVVISGKSNLKIGGRYLVVSGLTFKGGYSPSPEVISFRRDSKTLAYDSRVTETVIDGFNNPDRAAVDYWIGLYGKNNRVDHSHLQGKLNSGVTLAVVLNSAESQQNHHRIDHNYFGPRPPLGSNGGETIRVGTSEYSLTNSLTVVEDNYFEGCSGEGEIVSNKSGGNIYRRNVFVRSQGALVLRHGNGNLVEDNVFLGGGVPHTGGVRVINADQTVRNNYFQGLGGNDFTAALVMMNGVPNSPINRYNQVLNARIEKNVFVDVKEVLFGAGADQERSLAPAQSTLSGNAFLGSGKPVFKAMAPIDGLTFTGNLVDGVAPPAGASGFEARTIGRETLPDGRIYPDAATRKALGLKEPTKLLAREETGVAWYPKGDQTVAFDSGRVLKIKPGQDQLSAAAAKAKAGDVIELAAGDYAEGHVVEISQPLTFRAEKGAKPVVTFDRSTLFSLIGRGSLKLQGLRVSGADAPDSVGNAMIRVNPSYPLNNYAVEIVDTEIADLKVNKAFAVLKGEKNTFADHLTIRGSRFTDISGAVVQVTGETDNFGIYGVEKVDVTGSQFMRLGAPAFDILRGGVDESTFGPQVRISGSAFRDVAPGQPSMKLDGVQIVKLDANVFERAAPARVIIHVGKPDLSEAGNTGAALEIVDQRK